MFRLDTVKRLAKSFALHYVREDPTFMVLNPHGDRAAMDGFLYEDLCATANVTSEVLRRTLMFHL